MCVYPVPKRLRSFDLDEESLLKKYFSNAEIRRIKREINNAPNAYSAATGEKILVKREIYDRQVIVAEVKFDAWNYSNGGSPWVFCLFPYGEPREPYDPEEDRWY